MGCSSDGDEEVIDEMLNYRHHHRVAHGVVRFVVGGRKTIALRRSHQLGGFAGSDFACLPNSGVVEQEKLATAASFGGTEATGEIVETEFEYLFALSGAAVSGEDGTVGGRESVNQLLVLGCDEREESGGSPFIECRSVPIDDLRQNLGTLGGPGNRPENNVVQQGDGPSDNFGVKPVRAVVFESGGVDVILNGNDKDSGARLGDPEPGIEQHWTDFVGALAKGVVEQPEIFPAIGGKQADDILEGNRKRLDGHLVEDP
jgi:hypothetical protein